MLQEFVGKRKTMEIFKLNCKNMLTYGKEHDII